MHFWKFIVKYCIVCGSVQCSVLKCSSVCFRVKMCCEIQFCVKDCDVWIMYYIFVYFCELQLGAVKYGVVHQSVVQSWIIQCIGVHWSEQQCSSLEGIVMWDSVVQCSAVFTGARPQCYMSRSLYFVAVAPWLYVAVESVADPRTLISRHQIMVSNVCHCRLCWPPH